MFEQDYLMRMIMQLIEGIQRSMEKADGDEEDPSAAADMLEGVVGAAVDMDGGVLLSLSPDSIASVLRATGTDEGVTEYVARSLYLESAYLSESGDTARAQLRRDQALALADAFGFSIDGASDPRESTKAFLAANQPMPSAAETD